MADRYLLDVNICLDVLLKRDPHWHNAAIIFEAIEKEEFEAAVSAISFDTMFYVMRSYTSPAKATDLLKKLASKLNILDVTGDIIRDALQRDWKDLEDCIQYCSGIFAGCEGLVTRDAGDYPTENAEIVVYSPSTFISEVLKG